MNKIKLIGLVLGSLLLAKENVHAHSHRHTYIVEQVNPAPVIIVQPTPQPVVVVQPAETPLPANAPSFESPPVDLVEQIPSSPGEAYVWQKGYWQWKGHWHWVTGQWAVRPMGHNVYVPGYWKLSTHHHRWEWVEPYWK